MPLTTVHVERDKDTLVFFDARAVEGNIDLFVYRDGKLLARIDRFNVRAWWIEERI